MGYAAGAGGQGGSRARAGSIAGSIAGFGVGGSSAALGGSPPGGGWDMESPLGVLRGRGTSSRPPLWRPNRRERRRNRRHSLWYSRNQLAQAITNGPIAARKACWSLPFRVLATSRPALAHE